MVIPWLERTTPELVIPWLDIGVPVAWTFASMVCCWLLMRRDERLRRTPGWAVLISYAWPVHLSIWAHRQIGHMLAPRDGFHDDRKGP